MTAAGLLLALAGPAVGKCALEAGPSRAVTQVIDAGTVKLDDGSEVRLAGTIAPRAPDSTGDAALWPPADDAKAMLETLVAGRSVEITFAGPRSDRYGRTLAQVFVSSQGQRIWVQGAMLSAGHARVYGPAGGTDCLDELMSHERLAFHARQGLWAHAAYQVRGADDVQELMRFRHTLQVIEGVVAEVAESKGRIYLNFGTDWRTDFTAGIERGRSSEWSRDYDFKSLKGERVRVRGFIERRNGPYVELTHPSQLEVIAVEQEPVQPPRRSRRRPTASPE